MFLPEEPLLDAEEARLPHGPGAVEGGPGAALLGLVGGVVHALRVVILRHRRGQGHPVIVRDLQQQNILFLALEIGTL